MKKYKIRSIGGLCFATINTADARDAVNQLTLRAGFSLDEYEIEKLTPQTNETILIVSTKGEEPSIFLVREFDSNVETEATQSGRSAHPTLIESMHRILTKLQVGIKQRCI